MKKYDELKEYYENIIKVLRKEKEEVEQERDLLHDYIKKLEKEGTKN